jgi:DNA-binding MarR family transcriptional regulator
MHHQRSETDRRSVRVRLTPRGTQVREAVADLFRRQAEGLLARGVIGAAALEEINGTLRRMERSWAEQIRYIY